MNLVMFSQTMKSRKWRFVCFAFLEFCISLFQTTHQTNPLPSGNVDVPLWYVTMMYPHKSPLSSSLRPSPMPGYLIYCRKTKQTQDTQAAVRAALARGD